MGSTSKHLHRPRYWFTHAALGLAHAFTFLPIGLQLWFGRRLGDLAYLTLGGRRRVAKVNLTLCFPDYSARDRRRLLRESFRGVGMGLMETFLSWWCSHSRLRPLFTLEGWEYLEAARREGRGVILLTAHFTALELGARLLNLDVPVTAMYRPNANPLLERTIRRGREAHTHGDVIAKDDVRGFLKRLKAGHVVWYAPDQNVQRSQGIPATFFGHPAITTTATSRLARVSGATIIPFLAVRRKKLPGYRLVIRPPLENFPGADETQNATRINQLFEEMIRLYPEQYFWLHRRFKRMPGGDLYRKGALEKA